MRLTRVELQEHGELVRLVGYVTMERSQQDLQIYLQYPVAYAGFVYDSADPFAAILLIFAMSEHEALEIAPPVSPMLSQRLPRIRDIFHSWYPQFGRIAVKPQALSAVHVERAGRTASFYSGGVDSLYSALKRSRVEPLPSPLTHLIFMRGVETRLSQSEGVDGSIRLAEEVAERLGVQCLIGETNIRTVVPLHWEDYLFGSALAAIGLSLATGFDFVCIPSSFGYSHLVPHGSTVVVDELFSTECLSIVHDGAEVTRAQKVARCIEWDRALTLRYLRVCMRNSGGAHNCGHCYKCVRTAVALAAVGAWEDAETFQDKSRAHWEATMRKDHLAFTEQNLSLLEETRYDPALLRMVERTVRKVRREEALNEYVRNSPLEALRPLRRRIAPVLRTLGLSR